MTEKMTEIREDLEQLEYEISEFETIASPVYFLDRVAKKDELATYNRYSIRIKVLIFNIKNEIRACKAGTEELKEYSDYLGTAEGLTKDLNRIVFDDFD